ncbi:MAG: hypothetical protein RR356_02810 [Bacteroidales bacterium]
MKKSLYIYTISIYFGKLSAFRVRRYFNQKRLSRQIGDLNPAFLAFFEHDQAIILAYNTGVKIKNIASDLRAKGVSNFACLIDGIFE